MGITVKDFKQFLEQEQIPGDSIICPDHESYGIEVEVQLGDGNTVSYFIETSSKITRSELVETEIILKHECKC